MRTSKTNILFIESGTTGGGSFESVLQHIKCLNSEYSSFYVICLNKTKYNQLWEQEGVKVFYLKDPLYSLNSSLKTKLVHWLYAFFVRMPFPLFKWFISTVQSKTIKAALGIIRENNIEFVHLNNQPLRDTYGLMIAQATGIPCFSHLRSMRLNKMPGGFSSFANTTVTQFIANSQSCSEYWIQTGISASKVQVVYNAVEPAEYDRLPKKNGLNNDKSIRFGMLANFSEAKGHRFLVKAFATLLQLDTEYRLYLAGTGPGENAIRALVKDLGISDNVIFMGYLENTGPYFDSIDIMVVPSKSESFGRVVLEAWQNEKPVIATKVGGIVELIEEDTNGLLVNYDDPDALVNAMHELARNRDLRNQLSAQGTISLNSKFSTDRYSMAFTALYEHFSQR